VDCDVGYRAKGKQAGESSAELEVLARGGVQRPVHGSLQRLAARQSLPERCITRLQAMHLDDTIATQHAGTFTARCEMHDGRVFASMFDE
jgi:hypothetical protein